jgi:hypothetical protein
MFSSNSKAIGNYRQGREALNLRKKMKMRLLTKNCFLLLSKSDKQCDDCGICFSGVFRVSHMGKDEGDAIIQGKVLN